jgi:hypothetical protein
MLNGLRVALRTEASPVAADLLDVHEPDHEERLHDVREEQQ